MVSSRKLEVSNVSRALLLGGGAFRGAVQVPIIARLFEQHKYDAVYGVSVGSLNGVMFAQHDIDLLWSLWTNMRGVKDFLRISLWPFNGLYSMRPLRKKLEMYTCLKRLKIPFSAGVVSLINKKYYNLCSDEMMKNRELWDACEASSAIVGIMKSPEIIIEGKKHQGADGGFRNIIPTPAPCSYDYIDVVPCTPLDRENIKAPKHWNTLSLAARGIEVMEDEIFNKDYLQIAAHLNPGGVMTVYAPREDTGPQFDASCEMIQKRFEIGQNAYFHPKRLTRKQADLLRKLLTY